MKLNFDIKSIKFRLWISFLIIAVGILSLVWAMQVLLLNNSYEGMKTREVENVASVISSSYLNNDEKLTESIRTLSVTSDLYVMMERSSNLIMFKPEGDSLAPVYQYRAEVPKLKDMITNDPNGASSVSYKFSAHNAEYSTLAYCRLISPDEGEPVLLYIFAPLFPVTSTVNILRAQLANVTIASLCVAFLFALVFADRISRPIKHITAGAKRMGKGDYRVHFDSCGYTEIDNLSSTLNTACVELERMDDIQRDMMANVSHDLKTPLTMIKSYAEMIMDISGDNPEKRAEHLNVIIHEADRMNELVNDMSTLSMMQNSRIKLKLTTFDLNEAAESILASYKILEGDGYRFTLTAPKECRVIGDEARINQVIANLTGNAVKYCGDNRDINIIIKKSGRHYRLEVRDHGVGIPKDELPHVWDRYYRASTNYARTSAGTGLGLSIVKQILMLHNADYGAESEEGKGSTFWFQLEAARG